MNRTDHRPLEYRLSQLDTLEAESIHIIREVAAELERPVLLFSGGKDSIVMLRLAREGVLAGPDPVPGHARRHRAQLPRGARRSATGGSPSSASSSSWRASRRRSTAGLVHEPPDGTRNRIQTPVLLEALEEHGFAAAFGGARRDEDKARAKERVFSFRDEFGQWDPKNQRPELWTPLQRPDPPGGEHPGVPAVELDRARHLAVRRREQIDLPTIYFAHEREVFERGGMLYADNEFCRPKPGEETFVAKVRYRTVGDASLTAAVRSEADTIEAIIEEVAATRITERGATRGDDKFSEAAMEDRKREGYF